MSIQTFDKFLNPTNHSSDSIFAHLELEGSLDKIEVMGNRVHDSSSNSTIFLFQQHITKAGRHLLHTTNQDGAKIGSSPFSFTVVPAAPSAPHCAHNLVDEFDLSKKTTITLQLFPFDKYDNTVTSAETFQVDATLQGAVLFNGTVLSGSVQMINVFKAGDVNIIMKLNGKHIKGSPHTIEAFTPMNEVLDANTVVTAVLGGGAFVFLSFAVYKAATKKGRENVMDEVTEARKCILPFVLDLVDIATDVGE